jgi:hypothetical protein
MRHGSLVAGLKPKAKRANVLGLGTGFGLVVDFVDLGSRSLTGFEPDSRCSTGAGVGLISLVSLEAVKAGFFWLDLGGYPTYGPLQPSLRPCLSVGWDPLILMAEST